MEMERIDYKIRPKLEPYINCIMARASSDPAGRLHLPLYADGYPGIMYQQTPKGIYLLPRQKKLSELFLYGQTVDPVALEAEGSYAYVVIQLYPFASKYLLDVDPKVLNDDCFDLLQESRLDMEFYQMSLAETTDLAAQVEILYDLMEDLLAVHQVPEDDRIQQALALILQHEGRISIKEVLEQLPVTERTFERNFMAQVGLSPKQFARIIQFQSAFSKLSVDQLGKLVEVGADSGFADQSHFIRTFKKYTGQTPSWYLKQLQT